MYGKGDIMNYKVLCFLFCLILCLSTLSGCKTTGNNDNPNKNDNSEITSQYEETDTSVEQTTATSSSVQEMTTTTHLNRETGTNKKTIISTTNTSTTKEDQSSGYIKSTEDILKTYFTSSAISKTQFLVSASYMENGTVKDTMFQSFAFIPTPNYVYQSDGSYITTKKDWQAMLDELFLKEKNIDALEMAVGEIKSKLNQPKYKVKVYLPLLAAEKGDVNFGEVNGENLALSTEANRLNAVTWLVQEEIQRFKQKNYKNIELAGFFWFKESINAQKEKEHVKAVTSYVHSIKYEIIWSPFYMAEGYSDWKEYGFDRVSMQANYYPGVAPENAPNNGPISRLSSISSIMKNRGIGIEMELGSISKNSITGFKQYMKYGIEKGYMHTYHVWYLCDGPGMVYKLYHSKDNYIHSAYKDMYKFIKRKLELTELVVEELL